MVTEIQQGTPSTNDVSGSSGNIRNASLGTIYPETFFNQDAEEQKLAENVTAVLTLEEMLIVTDQFFIHSLDTIEVAEPLGSHPYATIDVRTFEGERIFICNQTQLLEEEEDGRLPITYQVFDTNHRLIMSIEGRETSCNLDVVFTGEQNIIRGRLYRDKKYGYFLRDCLNDAVYHIPLSCWTFWFTCVLLFKHPIFQILVMTDQTCDGRPIAMISRRKWPNTKFDQRHTFGIEMEENVNVDTKLFLLAASLVLYYLYFKKTGRGLRCLVVYVGIVIAFVAIVYILFLYIMIDAT